MPTVFLDDRGVVRVGGADARTFLQGLFTCDMDKVAPGRAAFGALLTPQGKIIVDFIVTPETDGFLLDCPQALAADLARRLGFYKLRARVEISDDSSRSGVLAHWGGADAAGVPDPRNPDLGAREIVGRVGRIADPAARAAYESHRIGLGVPSGGVDFDYGDAFPHEANMDLLNGVDFRKGCYVGQEVVSRVEHRGTARKRVARVRCDGAPLATGAALTVGGQEVGTIGSTAPGIALALVRIDRAGEALAAGAEFSCEGRTVTLALPPSRS